MYCALLLATSPSDPVNINAEYCQASCCFSCSTSHVVLMMTVFAAVGEPPMCLGYGVVIALRQAITAARTLAGNTDWFDISKQLHLKDKQFN